MLELEANLSPFARQGGQSGYRAIGPLPFGNHSWG
jgi:hypothetical protein